MITKVSFYPGDTPEGPRAIPLHTRADAAFEKIASPTLLPEVVAYIEHLQPGANSQYVLVNAMGAGEFYGSNINGDYFPEESLIHRPDEWTGNPLVDKIRAKSWPYGFPTFYNAHPFAHHRNKDPSRAFGEVELAVWNNHMKRVELVCRVDKDKCLRFGGHGTWDKLQNGQFPDVSMGTRVPWDRCSICTDMKEYKRALATYDPKKHKHPGIAVLEYHKKLKRERGKGIRGISVTRDDYCEHARKMMNRIFLDGRKVYVINDFPRFFDISFVFVGADKTAKTMMKIAEGQQLFWFLEDSAKVASILGYEQEYEEATKTAAALYVPFEDKKEEAEDLLLKSAFRVKTGRLLKASEIVKDTIPSQFAGKAIPILARGEKDLDNSLLDSLADRGLKPALASCSSAGVVLKPREFQRIVLIVMGKKPLADKLDEENIVFSRSKDKEPVEFGTEDVSRTLLQLMLPYMLLRSALGPYLEKRVLLTGEEKEEKTASASSHPSPLLNKISSAYNGYREQLMNFLPETQTVLKKTADDSEFAKLAEAPVGSVFTPLSFHYFKDAFTDAFGDTGVRVLKTSM